MTVQSAGKTLFNVTKRKIGYERNCLTLEEKKGSEGVESDQFKTIPGQLKDQPCHVVDDPLKRKGHESVGPISAPADCVNLVTLVCLPKTKEVK